MEGAGGQGLQSGVKTGLRIGRQPIKENAEGVDGIELSYGGVPLRSDGSIRLSGKIRGAKLAKEFFRGVVREAEITIDEFLVEDRSAKKTPHLLLFDRISRDRQNVTAPGKDGARNLPIERGAKGERPFLKGEAAVAPAELDGTA